MKYKIYLCLLALLNCVCVPGGSTTRKHLPAEFLWSAPFEEVRAHRDVKRHIAESANRSQYEQVAHLARLLGREGIVCSYRLLYVSLRKPPLGIAIEWYIRTPNRVVFVHNYYEGGDLLEEDGHPGILVVFLDEKTAAAFEERIAVARPFALESASDTGSSGHMLSFFSVQEGSRVAECRQFNLISDEGTRKWLREKGGEMEKEIMKRSESAAAVRRAFDWLREQLLEKPAERPNGGLEDGFN